MTIHLELNRTFTKIQESPIDENNVEGWWLRYGIEKSNDSLSWTDIIANRAAIILGEAGIGKTHEFKAQAKHLRDLGKHAFFVPITAIDSIENLLMILNRNNQFETWKQSGEHGYFFLDSVDESRLTSHQTFIKALTVFGNAIIGCEQKLSLFLSSRASDWGQTAVRRAAFDCIQSSVFAIEEKPTVERSRSIFNRALPVSDGKKSDNTVEAFVVTMDALSDTDSMSLAVAHGVGDVSDFWDSIVEGGYASYANHPLDCEWLAKFWIAHGVFGNHSQLIENLVTNRLREQNIAYTSASFIQSEARLREGAEALAASCIFSKKPYIAISESMVASSVYCGDVLHSQGWREIESRHLLGTAIFDESTFGRVQFHHRSTKEYLSACWVKRKIDEGLPHAEVLYLFFAIPYDNLVVLESRIPVLAWLASMDNEVREVLVNRFPEIILLGGDIEQWSTDEVVEAFCRFLPELAGNRRFSWFGNSHGNKTRLAKALPSKTLSEMLTQYLNDSDAVQFIFMLILNGRKTECEDAVYAVYSDETVSNAYRIYALQALSEIASEEIRHSIKSDLLSRALVGNELMSAALSVVGPDRISENELTTIFAQTSGEDGWGTGPMARATKHLITSCQSIGKGEQLLAAVLNEMPSKRPERFRPSDELDEVKNVWIYYILTECYLHLLKLLPSNTLDIKKPIYLDLALQIDTLHHVAHVNQEDLNAIRKEIQRIPKFRARLALEIQGVNSNPSNLNLLSHFRSKLVSFGEDDMDWLIEQSNASSWDENERNTWLMTAADIAVFNLKGKERKNAIKRICVGPEESSREKIVFERRRIRLEMKTPERPYRYKQYQASKTRRMMMAEAKNRVLTNLLAIEGGTDIAAISSLIGYIANNGGLEKYSNISLAPIHRDFGREVAIALESGLIEVWRSLLTPLPSDCPPNKIPGTAILGLVGFNRAVEHGLKLTDLTNDEAKRVLQFAIWETRLPDWISAIEDIHPDVTLAALKDWFLADIRATNQPDATLRAFKLTMKMDAHICTQFIELGLNDVWNNLIPSEDIQKQLLLTAAKLNILPVEKLREFIKQFVKTPKGRADEFSFFNWLGFWIRVDTAAAWDWIKADPKSIVGGDDRFERFAESLGGFYWLNDVEFAEPLAQILIEIWTLLNWALQFSPPDTSPGLLSKTPIGQAKLLIEDYFGRQHNPSAYSALTKIVGLTENAYDSFRIRNAIAVSSAIMAEAAAVMRPCDIPLLGDVYLRPPRTEAELFDQVVSRLNDICARLESGPFSERDILSSQKREEAIQLWLAARLQDTPFRRFSPRFKVIRESEVDDHKRPDIEVVAGVGKICIEIKPVGRGLYSANELVKTIRAQLVGQYVKKGNSAHGVLALFCKSEKQWKLPYNPAATFNELVAYLNEEAEKIKAENSHIKGLLVMGFDCRKK